MDPEKYFAEWDAAGISADRARVLTESQTIPSNHRSANQAYTRKLLRSGCVLICLTARAAKVGFDSSRE
jgi:hypothetical protein